MWRYLGLRALSPFKPKIREFRFVHQRNRLFRFGSRTILTDLVISVSRTKMFLLFDKIVVHSTGFLYPVAFENKTKHAVA